MGTIFKHNGKFFQCFDLIKKCKKMKLNIDEIEIIKDNIPNDILEKEFVNITNPIKKESDEGWFSKNCLLNYNGLPIIYKFVNKKTKETISSIYDSLDNLKEIININDYEIIRS